jgi:hypothetical protein
MNSTDRETIISKGKIKTQKYEIAAVTSAYNSEKSIRKVMSMKLLNCITSLRSFQKYE